MRTLNLYHRLTIVTSLLAFCFSSAVYAAITSRVVGFAAIDIGPGETKAAGEFFESFGSSELSDTLADQLDAGDDIHVWVGQNFNTYTLQDDIWRIPGSDVPMPAARFPNTGNVSACWVTRNNTSHVSILVSGYVPDDYNLQLPTDTWRLISYPHRSVNGHRLNDIQWAGATDGDELRIFNGSDWIDYVYDNDRWSGPAAEELNLRLGDSLLIRNHAPGSKAVAIHAPDFPTTGGIAIAAITTGTGASSGALGLDLFNLGVPGQVTNLPKPDLLVYDGSDALIRLVSLGSLDEIAADRLAGVVNLGPDTAAQLVTLYLISDDRAHTARLGSISANANAFLPVAEAYRIVKNEYIWSEADIDFDGLSDVWEYSHYATPEDHDGDSDPDYDGLNNRREQELGTDPNRQTLVLTEGWNLVAISCVPELQHTLTDQLGSVFTATIWSWNGQDFEALSPGSALEPTNGYWIHCPGIFVIDLPDTPYHSGQRTIDPGWNLVGMIFGGALPDSIPASSRVWGFEDGATRVADRNHLRTMTGYWLFSTVRQELVLP